MSFIIASLEQPSSWGDYGIIGMMFSSLVGLIWFFVRTSAKERARHTEFVANILDEGRKERSEMTERWVQSSDRLGNAIDRLADEISRK